MEAHQNAVPLLQKRIQRDRATGDLKRAVQVARLLIDLGQREQRLPVSFGETLPLSGEAILIETDEQFAAIEANRLFEMPGPRRQVLRLCCGLQRGLEGG